MPMYLTDASWDTARPLSQVLESLDAIVQRTGGQVVQVLQLENGLSLTIETPDDLSLFRIGREASELGLELTSRVALSRFEAEALDGTHRERNT